MRGSLALGILVIMLSILIVLMALGYVYLNIDFGVNGR